MTKNTKIVIIKQYENTLSKSGLGKELMYDDSNYGGLIFRYIPTAKEVEFANNSFNQKEDFTVSVNSLKKTLTEKPQYFPSLFTIVYGLNEESFSKAIRKRKKLLGNCVSSVMFTTLSEDEVKTIVKDTVLAEAKLLNFSEI